MTNETTLWIERLALLHKSQMRKAASQEGLQLVHVDALQYFALCNRYSNTAQALTLYLGQTKGSISQSLKLMTELGFLERRNDANDKRVTRLFLTPEGQQCLERIRQNFAPNVSEDRSTAQVLANLLKDLQRTQALVGFGMCKSCRHNRTLDDGRFQCGLTQEPLTESDVQLICVEHEFAG